MGAACSECKGLFRGDDPEEFPCSKCDPGSPEPEVVEDAVSADESVEPEVGQDA